MPLSDWDSVWQMVRSWLTFRRGRVEPLQDAEMQTSEEKTPSVSCWTQLRSVFRLRYTHDVMAIKYLLV